MIQVLAFIDRNAGLLLALVLVALVLWLSGCADQPSERPGTAAAAAADLQARAGEAAHLSDQAERDKAELAGKSAAADAAAKLDPTPAKIQAAVDARLALVAGEARAAALRDAEARMRSEGDAAAKAAAKEREADQAAQDYRSWVRLCRLVGGSAVVLGFVIGALISYATKNPRAGIGCGALVSGCGAVVIALGPATAWMPWIVGAALAVALLWWGLAHRAAEIASAARLKVAEAASRALDAVENGAMQAADEAKAGLGAAVKAARLGDHLEALRGPDRDWNGKA